MENEEYSLEALRERLAAEDIFIAEAIEEPAQFLEHLFTALCTKQGLAPSREGDDEDANAAEYDENSPTLMSHGLPLAGHRLSIAKRRKGAGRVAGPAATAKAVDDFFGMLPGGQNHGKLAG